MTTCESFDDRAEELALGLVPEPERRTLLDHVATCDRCRAQLDGLQVTGDELLHLAPEAEPPAGFAELTAALMVDDRSAMHDGRHPRRRWMTPVLATAAAIVIAVGAFVVGSATRSTTESEIEAAPILATSGVTVGAFSLVDSTRSVALVQIDAPSQFEGWRTCRLVLADGSTIDVGRWNASEIATGAWAAGFNGADIDPVRMDIVDDAGVIVASATL